MTGRIRKKLIQAQLEALPAPRTDAVICPLCERPIPPSQQDAHHLVPKSHGGVLTVVRPEVELEVVAADIPDHITVDLTGKQIGDVIHINDVVLPNGAKPTIARNFVIANIAAPAGLVASED